VDPALREFAEAPPAFVPRSPEEVVVRDARFFLSVSRDGRTGILTHTRFAAAESSDVLGDVREHAPRAMVTLTTADGAVAHAFRHLGFHDAEPPLEPTCAALALDREPPTASVGIDVRRVESYDDFLIGFEIVLRSAAFSAAQRDARRAQADGLYEQRRSWPGGQEWLASLDGRPAAYAAAIAGDRGLSLTGGATLPDARGRGCYRALVRARWDDAVARGTPALVTHAWKASRPILEHFGFERACTVYVLEGEP
jgi:hypothetical protein